MTGLFSLKVHIIGSWSFFFCYFLSSVFSLSEMLLRWVWPLFVNLYCLLIKIAISILLYCLCFPWLVPLVLLVFFFFSNQNFHFPDFLISDCKFFMAAFQIYLKYYVNILSINNCLLFLESSLLFPGSPFLVMLIFLKCLTILVWPLAFLTSLNEICQQESGFLWKPFSPQLRDGSKTSEHGPYW